MAKNKEQKSLDDIKKFIHANKHLLIIVANPATDELVTAFSDIIAHTRFRTPDNKQLNVVLNVLKKSRFENTIDAFMQAFMEGVKIDEKDKDGAQFVKAVGGGIRSIALSK